MDIFTIFGVAVVSAAVCLLLKQYRPEYAMAVSIACGILLFLMILQGLSPVFQTMTDLMDKVAINSVYTKAIIKTLGVCYITQLASDACRDAGQTAIASKVELAGKVFIVLLSLPLFQNLVEIAFSLINSAK